LNCHHSVSLSILQLRFPAVSNLLSVSFDRVSSNQAIVITGLAGIADHCISALSLGTAVAVSGNQSEGTNMRWLMDYILVWTVKLGAGSALVMVKNLWP
jgi:hypothetical protein